MKSSPSWSAAKIAMKIPMPKAKKSRCRAGSLVEVIVGWETADRAVFVE